MQVLQIVTSKSHVDCVSVIFENATSKFTAIVESSMPLSWTMATSTVLLCFTSLCSVFSILPSYICYVVC